MILIDPLTDPGIEPHGVKSTARAAGASSIAGRIRENAVVSFMATPE